MDYTKMKGCHPGGDPVGLKGPDGMNTLSSYQAGREDTITIIRDEIERLKEEAYNSILPDEPKYRTHYKVGKKELCEELLSFLDTLQEPEISNELLEPTRAVRLPDGRWVTEKLARQIDINLLNKAADELALRAFPEKKSYSSVYDRVVDYNAVDRKNYRDGIIAGAELMKKQMMEEAVEVTAEICKLADRAWITPTDTKKFGQGVYDHFKAGDKVRIIIVKED